MTAADAEARLLALPRFATQAGAAYAPGLDRVRALLAAMGHPERAVPAIHVAGTNGKGSTASFVASILHAAGLRVGLHTSPHLHSLRERMRTDGVPASQAWLADAVGRYGAALDAVGPSFFEATVALSLLHFAEADAQVAVVEVGLGGRLDATNAVEPIVSVVTHVGLDHTELLGETVEAIAREKAGIAREGVPFVHGLGAGGARAALEAEARARGAGPIDRVRETVQVEANRGGVWIETADGTYGPVELGLAGAHQTANAALAVRAVEAVLSAPPREAVVQGLREVAARTGLRGRGERWSADPRIVLDVAHNADGWEAAVGAVELGEGGRLFGLVGAMRDKDVGALAAALGSAAHVWCVPLDGDRAMPADELALALGAARVPAEAVADAAAALDRFREAAGPADRLLVTGSHLTVAAAMGALWPRTPGQS